MKPEPVYVEDGEEFENEDISWRYIADFQNQEMIEKAFRICGGRKYFKSPKEGRIWRRIDAQVGKGMIRMEWIENCMRWAAERNGTICAIKVDALGHLVLNKARMQDWLSENKVALISPDDYR